MGIIVIEGSEILPDDIPIGLEEIREWAFDQGLIWNEELQIVLPERIAEFAKYFPEDFSFSIALQIYKDSGKLSYFETPYVPIAYLIQKGVEVNINTWKVCPAVWQEDGTIIEWGQVYLTFFFQDIEEQLFYTVSYSKRISTKFFEFTQQMPSTYENIKEKDGSIFIDAFVDVEATFFKNGRSHDVRLRLVE